jgi:glutamyl-tRNA(Gln) and/or aspartyl-tRNA(Asn) amidotransferase, C subunit
MVGQSMVSKEDVAHIATIADIGVDESELELFTASSMQYWIIFDVLDSVPVGGDAAPLRANVFRDDEVVPSLSHDEVLMNATDPEDGFIRAPRVI